MNKEVFKLTVGRSGRALKIGKANSYPVYEFIILKTGCYLFRDKRSQCKMKLLKGSCPSPWEWWCIRVSVLVYAVGISQIHVSAKALLLRDAYLPFLPPVPLGNCTGWWGKSWLTATGHVILYNWLLSALLLMDLFCKDLHGIWITSHSVTIQRGWPYSFL